MKSYFMCVTKYGFATIEAETEEEAIEICESMSDHEFDWGDLGDAKVIEERE